MTPISETIAAALAQQLADGKVLPQELTRSGLLAQRFCVSPHVIRMARRYLEGQGLISLTPSGYIVSAALDRTPDRTPVRKREAVEQFIVKEIADGRYKPGDLVATGAELAHRFGVSLSTAGNALRRLKDHGVLHGGLGSAGTRVAVPGQNPPATTTERAAHVAAVIRRQIEDGTYPSGTLLPSNRVLARAHRIPGHVVVQVIKILAHEELVETRASIGKLVRDPREKPGSRQLLSTSDQFVEALRDDILNGALGPGEPLPSTVKLAHRYGLSQTTVAKSMPKLLAEGLIVEVPSMSGRFLIRQTRRNGAAES